MIIGIDGGFLSASEPSKKTGVYQVSVNFLREISKIDKNNNYKIFVFDDVTEPDISFPPNFSLIKVIPSRGWNYFGLPLRLLISRVEIFLGLSQNLPIYCPVKKIVFVYDVAFHKFPELYKNAKKLDFQTRRAVIQADKIICTSESTKDDLIKIYPINPKKIKVIYPGYDSTFKPASKEEIETIRKKYSLFNNYLLFVGSLRKIKNIPFIIRGFSEYLERSKEYKYNKYIRLVLCGGFSWLDEEIATAVKDLGTRGNLVVKLGHVPREDLPALYSGAKTLVSPSLYEGFGLTFLEAMACGCPVIASRNGSTPEVVGNAALLVDPKSIDELTEAISSMMDDKFRQKLITLGFKQIKRFNRETFARGVLKEIKNLCPS